MLSRTRSLQKIKYVCIIVFIINLTADNLLDTKHMILKNHFMNCSINLIALDAVIFNQKTTYSNIIIINAPYLFYVQFLRALNM